MAAAIIFDKNTSLRSRFETPLAIATLILAALYVIMEAYYQIASDQSWLGYSIDLIAQFLMIGAAVTSLRIRPRSAAGWLAGAWGFALCLNFRAFAWRFQANQDGTLPEMEVWALMLLGGVLGLSAALFALSMALARPKP